VLVAGFLAWLIWRIYFRDEPGHWITLGTSAGLWLTLRLMEDGVQIPTLSRRASAVCFVLAGALPPIAYGAGAMRGKAIEERTTSRFRYADAPVWSGGDVLVNTDSRYLGTLGNFAFFWTDRDSVLIAQWSDVAPLELREERQADDEIEDDAD
jgi:hypothetical protein